MGLFNGEKLIVGYDLGNEFCQMSYCVYKEGSQDAPAVETISQVAGSQNYNIPALLCKREGVNQWFFGREAKRQAAEGNGILVGDLLANALDGEPVMVAGESFDPVALLTLFIKRSLGLLSQVCALDKMSGLMITCRVLDLGMLRVLEQVVAGLHLRTDRVCIQSYTESYFHYLTHETGEFMSSQSLLLNYDGPCIRSYRMECNRHTTPIVAFIEERDYPFYPPPEDADGEETAEADPKLLDGMLLKIVREICESSRIGSVFLIGDGFRQEWMEETLRFLCRGRRVFLGNNLFGKGACYGICERLYPQTAGNEYVFLGNEKLKANVGMKLFRQGEESYYAILDAGTGWYEAEHVFEFYVQDGSRLGISVTPLIGKPARTEWILLEDFPGSVARLRGRFYMEGEKRLLVEVTDLGFGEIRQASGKVWKKEIELY
jgi:hypothetical protein